MAFIGPPPGTVFPFAGTSAPTGYLICDGSSLLRASYVDLFGAIGTTWGAVDGTHFTLPDLRGRVSVGVGTHVDVATLGSTDGLAVGSRRPKHKHTKNGVASMTGAVARGGAASLTGTVSHTLGVNDPGHTHNLTAQLTGAGSGQYPQVATAATTQALADIVGSTTGITLTGGVNNGTLAVSDGITVNNGTLAVSDTITIGPQTGSEPVDSAAYAVLNHIIKI
jgi:microcystin-dependent protein